MRKRLFYFITVAAFVSYTAWMMMPYLRSAIVRDAAVTTWARAAVAPIAGRVATELPKAGDRVGEDGRVVLIRNDLLLQETRAVEDTRDKVIELETQIEEAKEYLADLDQLDDQRLAALQRSADVFHNQLETQIASLRREIAVNAERVTVLQRIADRQQELVERGAGSPQNLDEAVLRVTHLTLRQAELENALEFALLRDHAAEDGIYLTEDGGTPEWVRHGELELQLARREARHELHAAEAALEEARKDLESEERTLMALREAAVEAPPGSTIFSVVVAPNATVAAGTKIVEWIDCAALMVDVPRRS